MACMFCRGKNNLCTLNKVSKRSELLASLCGFELVKIPESVLLHIFSFLDFKELLMVRSVCITWRRIAEDKQLWRTLNMSCKRIHENNVLFRLPLRIRTHVRVVNLMWTYISRAAFQCTKRIFKNVEILLLQYCKFSILESKSSKFAPLPSKLKLLDVRNVQGSWFESAGSLPTFLWMEAMAFSQTMPSDWISRISTAWLPKLKILNIQNNPSLTDKFLQDVLTNTPNMESLCVQGCMYVRGVFLSETIKKLPNLQTLDLSGTKLEGKNICTVNWEHTRLTDLNLSFCCKVTGHDLQHVLPKLNYLHHLKASFVGWGRAFSDDVVTQILKQSSMRLQSLDIQSTFGLSVSSLVALCKINTELKHLRIGTMIKREEDLITILSTIPNIRCLSLQMGESDFNAPVLFNTLAWKCSQIESLFIYNISFESRIHGDLESSLTSLFTKCRRIRNFFTGGYPHKLKQQIDAMAKEVITTQQLKINCDRSARILPQSNVSFDEYMCDTLSKRTYNAKRLRLSFQKSINYETFYRAAGVQHINEHQFP